MKINFRTFACAGVALIGLLGITTQASAATLIDGNSTVTINPGSPTGVSDWTVNGVDQLNRDWFYFRCDCAASSIDTICVPTGTPVTGSSLDTSYANSQLTVSIRYSLLGGTPGFGDSQLSMDITVHNLSPAGALTFYNYGDFS